MKDRLSFLPTSMNDVAARGWSEVDFVYVTGDAYVDHPKASSFGGGGPLAVEGVLKRFCYF